MSHYFNEVHSTGNSDSRRWLLPHQVKPFPFVGRVEFANNGNICLIYMMPYRNHKLISVILNQYIKTKLHCVSFRNYFASESVVI